MNPTTVAAGASHSPRLAPMLMSAAGPSQISEPLRPARLGIGGASPAFDHPPVHADTRCSIGQAPNISGRDQLILDHLRLVKAIAVNLYRSLPVHVEINDLVQAGTLGLIDAANKYEAGKQLVFATYAQHRIRGAILDSLRELDWASRDTRRRHKQMETATRDLTKTLQRNPTEEEVAEQMGMQVERFRKVMTDLHNAGLISASSRGNDSEDLPAPDFPGKPETHPDFICEIQQLNSIVRQALKTLPERYQKLLLFYYSGEMTMKEIGGALGVNESRISQMHKAALAKMAKTLRANGINSSGAIRS